MSSAPIVPIALPLLGAALAAVLRTHRWAQRAVAAAVVVAVGAVGAHLAQAATAGAAVTLVVGGADARYRIALVADPFGALATVAAALVALAVLVTMALRADDHHPFLLPAVLVMLAGVWGSFLTGDLFNLFVFFEVALVASYVLLVVGGTRAQVRAGAIYVSVNLFGSLVFLAGVGLLYGAVGTVNLAVLATDAARTPVREVAEAVIVVAFALKAALLPLGGWLRVAYPVAPRAVAGLFAALLTTVGAVAIHRVVPIAFAVDGARTALLYAALATIVGAGLAALAAPGIWRIASLIVMVQAGLMVVGVGIGGTEAMAAGMTFVVQDVLAKGALFLALSATGDIDTGDDDAMTVRPVLVAVLGVLLLSLAGIPPTSGFVGKTLLLRAASVAGAPAVTAVVLTGSLLVLAAGARIWRQVAWTPVAVQPAPAAPSSARHRWAVVPAATLAALVLAIGIVPGWLEGPTTAAAELLSDPDAYRREVLG